jgi:hypothetical protein
VLISLTVQFYLDFFSAGLSYHSFGMKSWTSVDFNLGRVKIQFNTLCFKAKSLYYSFSVGR